MRALNVRHCTENSTKSEISPKADMQFDKGVQHMQRFECVADEIINQTDKIKFRLLDEIKGGNPIIFGAGDCGHKVYELLHGFGINVLYFCDNDQGKSTDELTGLKIIKPEEMRGMVENPIILVCVGSEGVCQSICQQLLLLGFSKEQIHIMNDYFYWSPREYFESNIERYRKVYQFLDDDFSRHVYLEKMKKVFLLCDISDIVSPSEEEYFDEKIILTDNEMFIDCGGFNGDTSVRFVEQCGGKYRGIVIFEPELCKIEAIRKNMSGCQYELYRAGVWSKKTTLCFDARGTGSSHIVEGKGGYMIETAVLDEIVYDKKPTYIKMDIEGAEQEALKGCKKIIQEYKPKLAICIYHKPEDLFEIPAMIKVMNPDYKLYVRQYADAWFDTVLYAV